MIEDLDNSVFTIYHVKQEDHEILIPEELLLFRKSYIILLFLFLNRPSLY